MGLKSGVSDLVVLFKGQVLFLELKIENGKQSNNQKSFEAEVKNLGFEYVICRSVADVEKAISYYE
jgi:hypothetical protein